MQDIYPPDDDRTKLEKLQDKLYSPSKHIGLKPRKEIKPLEYSTEEHWGDQNLDTMISEYQPKKRINMFLIVTIFAFLFFIGALAYGLFNFSGGKSTISGNDVDINIIGPVSIGGGEELSLDIIVQNNNAVPIETVDLVIEYPDGTKSVEDLKTDLDRVREGLGYLDASTVVKRTFASALFGEEGAKKEIAVEVEYRLPGSTAIFEKKKVFDIVLQSSPIRLKVESVKEVIADQELVFDIEVSSNSNQVLQNVMLEAIYPFGFEVQSSTRENYKGKNKWLFDTLKPRETQRFQIKGRLLGQDKEERVFKFMAGLMDEKNPDDLGVTFTNLPRSITISRPFLDLALSFDGDSSASLVKEGDSLISGELIYKNNTNANLSNVEILLKLDGAVLNEETVSASNGFYRSSDNTIIWDRTTEGDLNDVRAGQSGVLSFNFKSKPLAEGSSIFRNPEITINAIASGSRVSENEVPEEIESTSFRSIKFNSTVTLESLTGYSQTPFGDTGPVPPVVDEDTTYTITLSLKNTSNDLKNARVTANLPNYVRWNNKVSPTGEVVNYDQISRTLEWKLGDVSQHAGYTNAIRKISFQVTLNPSQSQIGSEPVLVNNIRFYGLDSFTNRDLNETAENATTDIGGNSSFERSRVTD